MALVMNASNRNVSVRVFGNHFEFKAGQIKNMNEKIAHFLITDRAYLGFVDLPEAFEDPSYKDTEEGKAAFEAKRKSGIEARCRYLRELIHNEEVSLKRDKEMKNDKSDPRLEMSDGMIANYDELAKYQTKKEDEDLKKLQKIEELQKKVSQ